MRYLISFAPGREEAISIAAASNGVAAAGLSLIAPVLVPKPVTAAISAQSLAEIRAAGAELINPADKSLISAAYVGLLILPFFWGAALWIAHGSKDPHSVSCFGFFIPAPFFIALGIYLVGVVYNELKEIV